jgi:integrase
LRLENITGTVINVEHSWNRLDGLKCTKTGKNRSVPVSPELGTALWQYILNIVSQAIFFHSMAEKRL